MTFSDVVSFAFRFINLFVLVYFVYYMFKKQGRASLEEAVAEQEAYAAGLQEQHHMLQARLEESKQEHQEQEQECLSLQHKIERWQEQHDLNNAKQQNAVVILHQQLMQRSAKQRTELEQSMIMQQSLQQALPKIQAELQKWYMQPMQAESFINNALSALKKADQ